ncbi:lysophospholipase [Xanthomonas translucens pv. hordei]|nr:methyltransferase [Xanthomonas translucens pv. translucens]KWV14967.1 methyltransferase [Xanthomonas translucens]UKE58508.1 lysophospholipase [Xanthomonas translucens pv. hordei]MQS43256.1 alpha/beta hydrolase [Xanthomonas translucens pv. translucens]OAX61376.1 methyltransferase [Xanthomonas translucens pv. translucens]
MRQVSESAFCSFDGTRLFYRHWPATAPAAPPRAAVLLHRCHEHSGRVVHLADELGLDGYAMFAWDTRGNGRSPGVRGDAHALTVPVQLLVSGDDVVVQRGPQDRFSGLSVERGHCWRRAYEGA